MKDRKRSWWRRRFHLSARCSFGKGYPAGLGARVFYYAPGREGKWIASVDLLFGPFDVQFGVHQYGVKFV